MTTQFYWEIGSSKSAPKAFYWHGSVAEWVFDAQTDGFTPRDRSWCKSGSFWALFERGPFSPYFREKRPSQSGPPRHFTEGGPPRDKIFKPKQPDLRPGSRPGANKPVLTFLAKRPFFDFFGQNSVFLGPRLTPTLKISMPLKSHLLSEKFSFWC